MALYKEEARQEIKEEVVVVLNILPKEDHEKPHIRGSLNVPLGNDHQAFVREVEDRFGRDKFFISYYADRRSKMASESAGILRVNGFESEEAAVLD
jgi:rhodanese-related sulfurtransferase